jgi:Zn-dependent protease
MTCLSCGAEMPPNLLLCPSCHALVHADELKTLAANAEGETAAGNLTKALEDWRRALELLPKGSAQYSAVTQKIAALVTRLDASSVDPKAHAKKPKWAEGGGALGVIGLLLWKFKFAAIFILTKGKLLLLGLGKASTFFSMLLSFWIYAQRWGWQFALGFVLSIYVHEMGHVYRLSRYGIRATAPMFIPFFGAMIRLQQYPATPHEEARVGLAGPLWGLGACIVTYVIHLATNIEVFASIAKTAAWINIFNLLPVWQLDGSHAFKALTKIDRGIIAVLFAALWFFTGDGLLGLIFVVMAFRSFQKDAPATKDTPILLEFAIIAISLSLLTKIAVNTGY